MNLSRMNKQQVFDIVSKHLLTQNCQSENNFGVCKYRFKDLKCAAGF